MLQFPPELSPVDCEIVRQAFTSAAASYQASGARGIIAMGLEFTSEAEAIEAVMTVLKVLAAVIPANDARSPSMVVAIVAELLDQVIVAYARWLPGPTTLARLPAFAAAVRARPEWRAFLDQYQSVPLEQQPDTPDALSLGQRLSQYQTEARLSDEKLAERAHRERTTIVKIKSGRAKPRPGTIDNLEKALSEKLGRPVKLTD